MEKYIVLTIPKGLYDFLISQHKGTVISTEVFESFVKQAELKENIYFNSMDGGLYTQTEFDELRADKFREADVDLRAMSCLYKKGTSFLYNSCHDTWYPVKPPKDFDYGDSDYIKEDLWENIRPYFCKEVVKK